MPDASRIRNADADAVFVVTAASRSMGLEFAKQLIERTEEDFEGFLVHPKSLTSASGCPKGISNIVL